jgi:hypothetical protein
MKALAAELDWSPSELSHRTTLGGDGSRPYPADDDHLIRIQRVTGDCSILATMADLLGYELTPKKERLGELLTQVQQQIKSAQEQMKQLSLELGETKGRGR